jgi:hypothetical protein
MAEDEDIRKARQARALIAARQAQAATTSSLADSLVALQTGIKESKEQVQSKNVEIPTIALEQAVNTGNTGAAIDAAKAVAAAQGGSAAAQAANAITAIQAASPKPVLNAANIARGDTIKWVGGVNGSWQIIKGTNVTTSSSDSNNQGTGDNSGGGTIFRVIGGILYANGSKYTGMYQGKKYVDGIEQAEDGSDGKTTYTAPDGKIFTNLDEYNSYITQLAAEDKRKAGQSAYDLLFSEFDRYGMGALLNDVKEFIVQGLSRDELLLKLRATPAYEKRFAANAQRIKKGLRALSEAEYINLEDQYQDVMRRYGLPESYYTRGDMGVQQGFEKFLAGDVSPLELEDRIQTGQRRVLNAPKEVKDALTQFYGAELGNGDILAYVLDPERAIENIKRKVTAAEIGAGAMQSGLKTGLTRAEELEKFGVTGERARTGYAAIAEFLPSATKLGDIYAKQGLGAYDQATAEQEVFGITGAAGAATKRRKLSELEQAQFSGSSGMTGGALSRERAGQF